MTTNANEIRQFCVASGCAWEPDALRQAYEAIVAAWVEANVPPDRLGGRAPGVGKGWKTFKPRDKLLRKTNFEKVEYFTLSHLAEPDESHPPNDLYPDVDWLAYATVKNWAQDKGIALGWIPAIVGGPSRAFFDLFRKIVSLGRARYGWYYQRRYNMKPFWEAPPETPASLDARLNGSWWEPDRNEQSGSLLLAGVYTQNFLAPEYLEAPFGRTAMTLREWIEDDPKQRGTLKPYTDILTEWTPPLHNIMKIREQLYRAGRIFYWRFFCPRQANPSGPGWIDEVNYRPDPRAPWEAPDPIPEIFRADYWKDKDPGLTY